MEKVLECRSIVKQFPKVLANDRISFDVRRGETFAIVGENGAGKSTLMNVIYGLYQPDGGELWVNGERARFTGPRDALAHGVGMVHQHFMLIPRMTVAENIVVGNEPGRWFHLDRKKACEQVAEISARYNLQVDPAQKIRDVTVGMQQRVEILKALFRGAEILILDEPSAVLTPQEIEELFGIIDSLKQQGKTILFITHKLDEVMRVADRVAVLRRGRLVGVVDAKEVDSAKLARMMVGHEVTLGGGAREQIPAGENVLEAENLTVKDSRSKEAVRGLNLCVRQGEIMGLAGVDGNGQLEFVEAVSGLRPLEAGTVKVSGRDISGQSVQQIRADGLGFIPEDRHRNGLVLDYSIAGNLILGEHQNAVYSKPRGWLNFTAINQNAQRRVEEYDIRPTDVGTTARNLSGGNQQKVIIAREMSAEPEFLIAVQPTRGLDIGAIEFVHKTLVAARNKKKGILLVSFELDEILALSDRVAVISKGRIVAVLDAREATKERLGRLMLGLEDEACESKEGAKA